MNKRILFLAIVFTLLVTIIGVQPTTASHSMEVVEVNTCLDGAEFTGEAEALSAVGIPMTGYVFEAPLFGNILLATGNTETFTSVGEVLNFTVNYPVGTFNIGDTIIISVSDQPTEFGDEGDAIEVTVQDCLIAPDIPAMLPHPQIGMISMSVGQSQPVYESAAGSIVRYSGGVELWLPQDYDGSGADTHLVLSSVDVDGRTWVEIFIGSGSSTVWVPLDKVTVIE